MKRAAPILALGAATLAVALLLLTTGGDPPRTIQAELRATNELRRGDPVRVDGIEVGEVGAIRLRPRRATATVELRIDNRDVQVRDDARATLRWGTLLGGSLHVDLEPGTGAPAERIPLAQTASQVELDDLTQPFDGDTGKATQATLRELRRGLADPATAGRSIEALGPAMRTIARGLAPLATDDLRGLVASGARTAAALGADERRLRGLVDGTAGTLRTTAARRAELGRLLALAPGALDDTRTTAARIDRTLARLDPLAAELRPGARALDPALRSTEPALDRTTTLLDDAEPLLRRLRPALASLERVSRGGRPLLAALTPPLQRLDDELLPFLQRRDPDTDRRTLEMIGPTAAVTASAASEFDGEGFWLRFPPPGDERSLLTAPCQSRLTDPSAKEKIRCDALFESLGKLLGGRAKR